MFYTVYRNPDPESDGWIVITKDKQKQKVRWVKILTVRKTLYFPGKKFLFVCEAVNSSNDEKKPNWFDDQGKVYKYVGRFLYRDRIYEAHRLGKATLLMLHRDGRVLHTFGDMT